MVTEEKSDQSRPNMEPKTTTEGKRKRKISMRRLNIGWGRAKANNCSSGGGGHEIDAGRESPGCCGLKYRSREERCDWWR